MPKVGVVTGTTAGAIMGQNKYLTQMNAWMRLLGLTEPIPDNEAMRWGRDLEPVLANRYHQDTGNILWPHIDLGLDYERPTIHPEHEWWGGTADRLIIDDPKLCTKNIDVAYRRMARPSFWKHVHGIWEAKTAGSGMKKAWDDGQVPPSYYLQVAWYMPIYRVQWADISVLIGGQDWRTISIHRDMELERVMHDRVKDFIEQYVLTETPPPVDDSPAWSVYLNKLFPKDEQDYMTAGTDHDELGIALRDVRARVKGLTATDALLVNKIKVAIGARAGIVGQGWKATWKSSKDSTKTDWKAIADKVLEINMMGACPTKEEWEKIYTENTKTVPGARVFRPSWDKEEEEEN